MEKTISKSSKRRQGHTYSVNQRGEGVVTLDQYPRDWKQVVEHTDSGMKNKKGKKLLYSRTKHVPA